MSASLTFGNAVVGQRVAAKVRARASDAMRRVRDAMGDGRGDPREGDAT